MTDPPRARLSWMLVASSVMLLLIVLYVLFAAYLPTKKHITRLEAELKDVYAREAQLQTRAAQAAEKNAQRDQQIAAFTAERDALGRRVEELEREISALKKSGGRPPRR